MSYLAILDKNQQADNIQEVEEAGGDDEGGGGYPIFSCSVHSRGVCMTFYNKSTLLAAAGGDFQNIQQQ